MPEMKVHSREIQVHFVEPEMFLDCFTETPNYYIVFFFYICT